MENKDTSSASESEDAKQELEMAPMPLSNQNEDNSTTDMGHEDCTSTSSSPTFQHTPEEMEGSDASKLEEEGALPSQSDALTSHSENDIKDTSSAITLSNKDATPSPCSLEVPVPLHNDLIENSNLNMESESSVVPANDQVTISCTGETTIPVPSPTDSVANIGMESEDCGVTMNSHDITIPSVGVPLPSQEEGPSEPMTPASPSHPDTPLPTTDMLTDVSSQSILTKPKSGQKVKKGLKRKIPSANKGSQTSIIILDSNSSFHDRIIDLDTLRKETGVVSVEDLQNLDVSLEEWPMLMVSQLRLRDTIMNNLNGVICELVNCGQVLEQDLDYLKLKVLELQQEIKKRVKDQQNQKNQGKEVESQTSEEDFTEAWNKWYYGCWGEYYSESDPTSSMYWPGHYTQQTTVASSDSKDETAGKVVEREQLEATSEVHEDTNNEKDSLKIESKVEESCCTETKKIEKRKKLKGKRKKKKSEKSSKEEDESDRKVEDVEKMMRKKEKRESRRRRKRREDERSDDSEIIASPRGTSASKEITTTTTSLSEVNNSEEGENKTLGWDTSQSIVEQVESVAAQAVVDSGYVFQEELGLYYDYNSGYYYNAENGLYYDSKSGTYFYYDHASQSYQFHSQVTAANDDNNKRRKRKTTKKKSTKSNDKNEGTGEREDGECTESDNERQDEEEGGESEEEDGEEVDATPSHPEEDAPDIGEIPPSLRLMVVEGGDRVRVGELHMVTLDGGTVGREETNDVHLPDLNVSKVHADIEYRSAGPDDHHYFLRDLGSNNGTFVNSVRLSEARQSSKQVEVGHGWEVQFGPIKVRCHLHPGTLTCNECEPGLVLQTLPSGTAKSGDGIASFKNAKSKEKARRKELKAMQKKYKLTQRDPQSSSTPAAGYTDRTRKRQVEKGSDNPYEKTEVASLEIPLKGSNRGFTLLQKMGWSEGQGLGKTNTGITEPVQQVSVVGKAGLGSCQPCASPPPDKRTHRRKKQLQITQERYKQFMPGH